jgi:DNA polymerase epsilon subunit 2
MSGLGMQEEADDDEEANDARAWLKVIDAYEQPRLLYNVDKKHFER